MQLIDLKKGSMEEIQQSNQNCDPKSYKAQCTCGQAAEYVIKHSKPQYAFFLCEACVEKKQLQSLYVCVQDYKSEYQKQYYEKNKNVAKLDIEINEWDNIVQNSLNFVKEFKTLTTEQENRKNEILDFLEKTSKGYISSQIFNQLQTFLIDTKLNQRTEALLNQLQQIKKLQVIKLGQINIKKFDEQFEAIIKEEKLQELIINTKVFQNDTTKKILGLIGNFIYVDNVPLVAKIIGQDNKVVTHDKTTYHGYIAENKKQGCGIYYLKNNNIFYFGIFDNDEFLWGIKLVANDNHQYQIYKGYFQNYEISGVGEMEAQDENITHNYRGEFLKGLRDGKGIYEWLDKDQKISEYNGEWRLNNQHGDGIHTAFTEKKIVQGKFENGLPFDVHILDLDSKKILKVMFQFIQEFKAKDTNQSQVQLTTEKKPSYQSKLQQIPANSNFNLQQQNPANKQIIFSQNQQIQQHGAPKFGTPNVAIQPNVWKPGSDQNMQKPPQQYNTTSIPFQQSSGGPVNAQYIPQIQTQPLSQAFTRHAVTLNKKDSSFTINAFQQQSKK